MGAQPRCQENWLCSDWSVCAINETQNRTCEDLRACQTTQFRPPLQQKCTYQPTCFDGVQNGNETGVDCGGDCPPCKTIQQPTILSNVRGFPTLWSLFSLLVLAILLALLTLYRERVYEGLAELGWLLSRRHEKELLLSPGEKKVLLEELGLLDKDLKAAMVTPQKAYARLSHAVRTYYSFALDLPFEYLPEEADAALAKAPVSEELRAVLAGFAGRLPLLESGLLLREAFNQELFVAIEEELRLLVCMTSMYELAEVERELAERQVTDEMSFTEEVRLRLLNCYEALQFLKADVAREEYAALLRAYENLPVKAKALLYPDISRLYLEVSYVVETSD